MMGDPYEEQLLAVFQSCDTEGDGFLNPEGLARLCDLLHLEDKGMELISHLATSPSCSITFPEFREALVSMLAGTSDQREPSPVREVSPKFVYGQKKYGRRSRPQSIDQDSITISDSDCESLILISDNGTNGDILVERLTEEDIKRQMCSKSCVTLLEKDYLGGETELRAAWERLGLGNDLRPNELATLYSAIGMDNVADQIVGQVFSSLNRRQEDGKVRFDELIDLLRCRLSSANSSPQHSNLMSLLEAVSEERDKLRNDLADANHRAQVLAQEIDEHHVRIEKATRNKVKLLEQKNQEEIKELKKELSLEREQLTSANQRLEAKLSQHVDQISKLNTKIASMKKNIESVEKENAALGERLSQSQSMNEHLHKQLGTLPALQIRVAELESNEEESASLRERIEELEIENKILKDSNDELKTQLESLAFQKREISWDNGISGTKRRGAEDSKESRLGKVRKCSGENDFFPFPCYYFDQDSSIDEIEVCPISGSSTFISLNNELGHLNPSSEPCSDDLKWLTRNEEKQFSDAEAQCDATPEPHLEQISKILSQASCPDKNCSFRLLISSYLQGTSKALPEEDFGKLSQFAFEFVDSEPTVRDVETQTESEPKAEDMEEKIYIEDVKGDENCPHCRKLEASLELLRVEYERTEDYWAGKLEEERTIFDMDQQESDERFSDLERKIEEYDELLSSEKMKSKLPTIEEKDFLEKQFTDLEEEYENFRQEMEQELGAKETLIASLEESLSKLSPKTLAKSNAEVQTEENSEKKPGICCCACHDADKKEVKRERELRTKLKFDYEDLLQEKFRLLNNIRSLQTSSQASARIIENLKCRVRDQEHHSRGLETQIKSLDKVTDRLLKDAWEKNDSEQRTLRDLLKKTQDRLERADSINKIQLSKLADADELVKNLFVEKSNLTFALAKLQDKTSEQLYNSF